EGLEAWSLAAVRGRAREHLGALPERDRLQLVAEDPALLLAAKRVAGVEAKARYLPALAEEWIRRPRAEVARLRDKLARTKQKLLASPRKMHGRYDWDEVQAKYCAPRERWIERS